MYCTKCGKQIPDSSKFCPYCGEPVKKKSQTASNEVKPVLQRKVSHKPSKKVLGIGAAAAAIVIVLIVILAGSGNMMKKFRNAGNSMANDWGYGYIGEFVSEESLSSLPSVLSNELAGANIKGCDAYSVDGDTVGFLIIELDKSSSAKNYFNLINDYISLYASSYDLRIDKSKNSIVISEDDETWQINRKGKYMLISVYEDEFTSQAKKFIRKCGF